MNMEEFKKLVKGREDSLVGICYEYRGRFSKGIVLCHIVELLSDKLLEDRIYCNTEEPWTFETGNWVAYDTMIEDIESGKVLGFVSLEEYNEMSLLVQL